MTTQQTYIKFKVKISNVMLEYGLNSCRIFKENTNVLYNKVSNTFLKLFFTFISILIVGPGKL